jgi:adiponectin receptor
MPSTITDKNEKGTTPKTNSKPNSNTPLTVSWKDLPLWQRDNHHIHTGYRPASNSFTRSIASLTYLHNETVNVYSHLLGAALALLSGLHVYGSVLKPRYDEYATAEDVRVFAAFFGGAVVCLGISAGYHLLANHSLWVAGWGNRADYLG